MSEIYHDTTPMAIFVTENKFQCVAKLFGLEINTERVGLRISFSLRGPLPAIRAFLDAFGLRFKSEQLGVPYP